MNIYIFNINFTNILIKSLSIKQKKQETKPNLKNLNYNLPFRDNYSLTTKSLNLPITRVWKKKKKKKKKKLIKKNGLILSGRGGGGDAEGTVARKGKMERRDTDIARRLFTVAVP